jgi:hypothetical protein
MRPSAKKCSFALTDCQDNDGVTFCNLREDQDFCDVTLVCEDNQQIPCHKVVLASSSQLLKAMLKSIPHNHPLLYFWGIKARDMARMVDFIYTGQVQVYQSDLQDFLTLAELLKVKGVLWGEPGNVDERLELAQGIDRNVETARKETHSYTEEAAIKIKLDETESAYFMNYNKVKDAPISEELIEKDFPKSNADLTSVWPSSPVPETTFDPTYTNFPDLAPFQTPACPTTSSDPPASNPVLLQLPANPDTSNGQEKKLGKGKPRSSSLWGFFTSIQGAE